MGGDEKSVANVKESFANNSALSVLLTPVGSPEYSVEGSRAAGDGRFGVAMKCVAHSIKGVGSGRMAANKTDVSLLSKKKKR